MANVHSAADITPAGIINRHSTVLQWGGTTGNPVDPFGAIAQNDTCNPDNTTGGAVQRSIQIEGTANGATVAVQGSNDGTNFENLNDISGAAITGKSTGVLLQIQQPCLWIKWVLTGGGASTAIVITLYSVRQF
jgi:hypothetical protein